jgi:hypothetical protein
MTNLLFRILLLITLMTAVSCSTTTYYYKPTTMILPNFKEKNEVYLSTNFSTDGKDVQAAYAITNHLTVQGNYQFGSEVVETESGFWSGNKEIKSFFSHGEFAAGYFKPFYKQGVFSILGGYCAGKMDNEIKYRGQSSANFDKWFIQSSVGSRYDVVEMIGSIKIGNLRYTNLNQSYTEVEDIKSLEALKNPIPILETGWLMRAGYEDIKIQFQATTTHLLTEPVPKFKFDWLSLSGGICLQLNTKKKVTWKSLWR